MERTTHEYELKLKSDSGNNSAMYSLGWKVEELLRLNREGRCILIELKVLLDVMIEQTGLDILSKVSLLRMHMHVPCAVCTYVGVYRHRQTAATHFLAILISSDDRKHKPYALPVQMVLYVGMSHNKMRKLLNKLILTMTNMGMTVVGMLHNIQPQAACTCVQLRFQFYMTGSDATT